MVSRASISSEPSIGVGLRHVHFADALASTAPVDFVEVHSENFFAEGGAARAVIEEASERYAISLHSTAMGLGSVEGVPTSYLQKLKRLAESTVPLLMSDHACFSWGQLNGQQIHAGDLLPLAYSEETLLVLAQNVDRVQQFLGRSLLLENLSAYITYTNSSMSETEFLVRLTELTGCHLLVDLNNIMVTAVNFGVEDTFSYAQAWLRQIPADRVGEIHLAGYTPAQDGELVVDDHSQPVSDAGWALYREALQYFGMVPTLVEWDSSLPSWDCLLKEAHKARQIAQEVFANE